MDLLIEIRNHVEDKLKSLNLSTEDFTKLYNEDLEIVRRKMRQNLMQKLVQQSLKQGIEGGVLQDIYSRIAPATEKSNKGFFVTINFDDSKIDVPQIPNYINKVLAKKWIADYEYVIEQRNETEGDYKGFHVHLLLKDHVQKRKCEVVREIYNTLKKYLGSKQSVDVRPVNTVAGIQIYMSGDKKDEWKHKKAENDVKMRLHYKFEVLYRREKQ